jgi:hypothetical protein
MAGGKGVGRHYTRFGAVLSRPAAKNPAKAGCEIWKIFQTDSSSGSRVKKEPGHAIIKRGFRQIQKLGVEDQFAFGDGIGDGLAGAAALLPA